MPTLPEPPIQLTGAIPDHWGLSLQVHGCPQCRQIFLIEESVAVDLCPYCFRHQLHNQPANIRVEPPELIIPFRLEMSPSTDSTRSLQSVLSKFTKGLWLHTKDFNNQSLLQRVKKIYMPMWLVDCTLTGDWEAESGFDYQVESLQDHYMAGEWRSNKVIETRIRWEPRMGQFKRTYHNIAVPATSDHHRLQQLANGFEMGNAQSYTKDLFATSIIRNPDLQPDESFPFAQSYLKNAISSDCRLATGAQHIRNFCVNADYESLNWTQLLLPYYSTFYFDDQGNPQVIWINGENGAIAGPRLASQQKGWIWAGISAGVALLFFLFALGSFVLTALFPPLSIVGITLVILAIAAGLFAIIPAVYPWWWNRKQLERKIHD